jgi:Family of unknown function (DUF5995)
VAAAAPLADVVARLRAVEASANASDGVSCFARMYREVTESINEELGSETFADASFLAALDVGFAALFFSALDAYSLGPGNAPSAWAPLFSARASRGIAPLQFAFAGMNAHINGDLPVALVSTCEARGVELRHASPEHADYERINDLLARVETRLKASYLTGWIARLDRILHRVNRLDDVVAMWDIRVAREAAWANAETLWAIRGDAALRADFVRTLDRTVGLASRGLLVPADTWLRRLARKLGA